MRCYYWLLLYFPRVILFILSSFFVILWGCGLGFNFWSCGFMLMGFGAFDVGPYLSFFGVGALYINIEE